MLTTRELFFSWVLKGFPRSPIAEDFRRLLKRWPYLSQFYQAWQSAWHQVAILSHLFLPVYEATGFVGESS